MPSGFDPSAAVGGDNIFGEDVAAYRDGRPAYPQALFDLLVERCELSRNSNILEVGSGTGQATRGLLDIGIGALTAIEPDPRLARHLAVEFGPEIDRSRLRLIASRFEDAQLPANNFDAVVAASSFHWVDPATRLERVKALLRPGGHLAIWWNVFHDTSGVTQWSRSIRPLFKSLVMPPSFIGDSHYSLEVASRTAEFVDAGFSNIEHILFRQPVLLTTRKVRAFYASFSPVLRLPTAERADWLDRIARLVDREFDGVVEHEVLTSLYTCRRP